MSNKDCDHCDHILQETPQEIIYVCCHCGRNWIYKKPEETPGCAYTYHKGMHGIYAPKATITFCRKDVL